MAEEMTRREKVVHMRESGFSDGQIAFEMQRLLPGGVMPSLNSIRRWRYGDCKPSPTYATVLDLIYRDAQARGLLKEL